MVVHGEVLQICRQFLRKRCLQLLPGHNGHEFDHDKFPINYPENWFMGFSNCGIFIVGSCGILGNSILCVELRRKKPEIWELRHETTTSIETTIIVNQIESIASRSRHTQLVKSSWLHEVVIGLDVNYVIEDGLGSFMRLLLIKWFISLSKEILITIWWDSMKLFRASSNGLEKGQCLRNTNRN